MTIETQDNKVVIKVIETNLDTLLFKLDNDFSNLKNQNTILDISALKNLSVKDLKRFLKLSKTYKKLKKSFVIVVKDFDYNAITDELALVPTLQEANDLIAMEEIERDLGF